MNVFLDVGIVFETGLDLANVQCVHHILYGLDFRAGCGAESQDAKFSLSVHQQLNDFGVGVGSRRFVSLVKHYTDHQLRAAPSSLHIPLHRLWRAEKDAPFVPQKSSFGGRDFASHVGRVTRRNAHNIVASLHLLIHKRQCRSKEDDFSGWEPSVVVVEHNSCN